MFGMFYTSSTSPRESLGGKKEKTALMKLKWLFGLDSGYSEEGTSKPKQPIKTTAKRVKSWGKKGKKKKLKNISSLSASHLPKPPEEQSSGDPVTPPVDYGILAEEEAFQDCLSELKEKGIEEEEVNSSCFVTPLSSPLSSRPGSQTCLCVSECDPHLSSLSESDYPGSTDGYRSTSPEQFSHQLTDSSVITTDDGNDSSCDTLDGPSLDSNGFNDSGISVSDSLSSPIHLTVHDHTLSSEASFPSVFDSDESSAPHNSEESVPMVFTEDQPSPHLPIDLQHRWVLYFDTLEGVGRLSRSHRQDYLSHVCHVMNVSTIQQFWSLFNHILLPSELGNSSNYHFFKDHIQPMWEDPQNKQGGKWVLTVKNNLELLDTVWMEMLLSLIGDQFKKPSQICGAVVSRRRKGDRIALWTRNKQKHPNMLVCKVIIQILLRALSVEKDKKRDFLRDALKSGSSYQNSARITVEDCFDDLLKA